MTRKTKGELEVEQLEQLYRLRRKGLAPLRSDPRFALAFAYEELRAGVRASAQLERELEAKRKAEAARPWTLALRKGWWMR